MVICIDIGNTNIKYAIYEGSDLKISFRVATDLKKTSDEYGAQLTGMLEARGISPELILGGIISSVVPTLDYTIDKMCELYLKIQPLKIAPGLKSGLNIRCDDAREVGADRIVNCVSAIVSYGENKPMIVVDFGTATTLSVVGEDRSYLGCCILPGIGMSLSSLAGTELLPGVNASAQVPLLGTNSADSMNAGVIRGQAMAVTGLTRELIRAKNFPSDTPILATGGYGDRVIHHLPEKVRYIPDLTLKGLQVIDSANRKNNR